MREIIIILVLTIIVLIYMLVQKTIAVSHLKRIKRVTQNCSSDFFSLGKKAYLHNYVDDAQSFVEQEYRITEKELDMANEIIENYQKNLIKQYFRDKVQYVNHMNDQEFFLLNILFYLRDHQCSPFLKKKMYGKVSHRSNQDKWGGYEEEWPLSDFGVVFHKIYYISLMFCKNSRLLNPKNDSFNYCFEIKKIIDWKTLSVTNRLI